MSCASSLPLTPQPAGPASCVRVGAPPAAPPPADSPFSWLGAPAPCDLSSASGPLVLSNWAIPQSLCVGGYPGALSVDKSASIARDMAAARFDSYVNLMRSNELTRFRPYAGLVEFECAKLTPPLEHALEFLHYPIGDGSVPSVEMEDSFLALVAELVGRLRAGRRVYIHCWGGHGRTGMLLSVMLAAIYPALTGEDAMDLCQTLHSTRLYNPGHKSPEPGQRAFVLRMVERMRQAQRLGAAWAPPQGWQLARLPYAPYVDPATASADRMDTGDDMDESALGHDDAARAAPASSRRSSARARAQAILSGQCPSTPPRAGGGSGVIIVDPCGTASTTAALAAIPSTPLMSPAVRRLSAEKAGELSLSPASGREAGSPQQRQQAQSQAQQGSLLPRQMVPLEDVCDAPDDEIGDSATPLPPAFTVLTMNVLAANLGTPGSFPHTDPLALTWENRRELLLDELSGRLREGPPPDVLCMQEVDRFDEWFSPRLEALGFGRGWFLPKRGGGSNGAGDGVALFVRPDSFRVLRVQRVYMAGMNQVALFLQLAPVGAASSAAGGAGGASHDSGRRLYVSTTHLKAKEGFEGVRLKQARTIIHHMQQFIARFHALSLAQRNGSSSVSNDGSSDGGCGSSDAVDVSNSACADGAAHNPPHASQRFTLPASASVVFTGDLNDTPQSSCYTFLSTGSAGEEVEGQQRQGQGQGQEQGQARGRGSGATPSASGLSPLDLGAGAAPIPSAVGGSGSGATKTATAAATAEQSPTSQAAAMVDAIVDSAFADASPPAAAAATGDGVATPTAPLSVLAEAASNNGFSSSNNSSSSASAPTGSSTTFSPLSIFASTPTAEAHPIPIPAPPLTHSLWLHSLYNRLYSPLHPANHPGALYTTAKRREVLMQRCIDYIFFSPLSLRPVALLSIPHQQRDLPDYLPCSRYPSDHLALAGHFEWKRIGH